MQRKLNYINLGDLLLAPSRPQEHARSLSVKEIRHPTACRSRDQAMSQVSDFWEPVAYHLSSVSWLYWDILTVSGFMVQEREITIEHTGQTSHKMGYNH